MGRLKSIAGAVVSTAQRIPRRLMGWGSHFPTRQAPLQWLLLLLIAALFTACDNPQRTVDGLKKDIVSYRANATDEGRARIEAGFAKLDQQIAKLNQKGDTLKAGVLERQRDDLATDYTASQLGNAVKNAAEAFKGFGKAFERAGKDIDEAVRKQSDAATNEP